VQAAACADGVDQALQLRGRGRLGPCGPPALQHGPWGSQARTARSARGQDGAAGGTAAPEPPLSASGFRLRRRSPAWCGAVTEPGGPAPGVVAAYKNLARVERGFRSIKSGDLDLTPGVPPPENASASTC
jgi:hypothetical protein